MNYREVIEIRNKCKKTIDHEINKKQREYDKTIYKVDSQSDKLTCQLCGGHYTRNQRGRHKKSIKHTKKLNECYDDVLNISQK